MKYIYLFFFVLFLNFSTLSQSFNWVFHTGGHIDDITTAMATDDFGNTYISGIALQADFGNNIPIVPLLNYYLAKIDSNGTVIWTQHIDNDEVFTQDILIDSNGDVIVVGYFEGQLNHQGYYANGKIQESSFVFKYDTSGTLIWAETFHSNVDTRRVQTWAATLDTNDNIYLTGFFDWDATIGGIPISPTVADKGDLFILKLNPLGNVVWVKTGGGTEDDEAVDIAYYNNYLYILGNVWSNTIQFDTITTNITSTNISKPIMIKYSLDGNIQSVKKIAEVGANSNVEVDKIQISSSGTVYIIGEFWGTAIFNPNNTIQTTNFFNAYLSRYDLNGNCIWARRLSELADRRKNLTTDGNNNVYLIDNYFQNFTTETFSLNAFNSSYDIYIAKYNEIGYPQWAQSGGSTEFDYGGNIRFDYQNRLVISGHYQGLNATFGGITFPNNSGNNNLDFFVASVNNVIPDTCPTVTVPIIATQTTFCEGDSIELKVNNPYAIFLQWYKDGIPITNATEKKFIASEAGLYTIGINENTVCLLPSTDVLLTMLPNPTLTLPTDTTICFGEAIDITAITDAPNIIWSSGDTNLTTTLSSNETTTAIANLNGCETSATITIGNRLLPNIQLTKNKINTLIASGGVFYEWYFEDSLYVSGEDSIFQALEYGTYQVVGYDEYGCKSSESIDIEFINCDEAMIFPNPNNGVFTVRTIPETIETIIIYNTLGQKIYQKNDVLSKDELLNLKAELSGGTYFISIKTANCTTLQRIIVGI